MKTYQKLLLLMLFAFILNLIWELLHYFLYIDLSGIPKYPHILLASFTDMILISVIFFLVSVIDKSFKWIGKPDWLNIVIIFVLSIVASASIEVWALKTGRWAYTSLMPVVFGLGVSPLVQLFATGILALFIIKLIKK